ncbi:Serine/threonine-protein phosphatase 5 [Mycoemilia scoparia]|uniref:Serine/threonine-protein phosphatase n=1 Tax=Mycoemilia scoparia TaxID=417184 RepID=A0A9W7ZV93_9FUNG|nr:Serine/threonine-protein phosphatase 5 [Mycoemilia scoparia]
MLADPIKSTTMPENNKENTAAVPPVAAPASTKDDAVKAEEIKLKANKLFGSKKYAEAIEEYSKAIKLNPNVPSYYTNRALCNIHTEAYGGAITDADKALELDPRFAKAYYRRATAHMALGKLQEARKDYNDVIRLAPDDKLAKVKLRNCVRLAKLNMMAEALSPLTKKVLEIDQIDLSNYLVDDDYKGPRLPKRKVKNENGDDTDQEEEYIDAEFVKAASEWFRDQKSLPLRYVLWIVCQIQKYLRPLPPIIDAAIPKDHVLTICGDVHGQYYDLLNIFKTNGVPTKTNMYLFNGDFVDRGSFSLETVLLLFMYKLLNPDGFFLNRGNHESINMNQMYGFEGEIRAKYPGGSTSKRIFNLMEETFECLPIAHVVQEKIFVVHGGLYSKDLGKADNDNVVTLEQLRSVSRFQQPGDKGLLCESLWSDPQDAPGRGVNQRGVALRFGPDVTKAFCEKNNLKMIVRSHEQKAEGYEIAHDGRCVTVFSAPNYCDQMGNKGAYMRVTPELDITYHQFEAVPHPNVKAMAYSQMNQFM